ncbi:hypothetical protein [Bradyrhizobium sp. SZCCHNR1098]|uniref:hypothetical protein n=1 Tax=Bradyrhizobium sp. SZCCHNR1098 TaxID=3057370 RepID=UPI0029162EC9|nr:hypothetical protein [Bradyrhizobium sp. SZCCHNR1098]
MADATIASIIPLPQHQKTADTALTQRPKTGAERQRAYKARLRAAKAAQLPAVVPPATVSAAQNAPELVITHPSNARLDRPERGRDGLSPARLALDVTPETLTPPSMFSRLALRAAALGLALVGLSMNAVYAHSLGSSDLSGWLFLALGLCADCAALALPSVAASCQDVGSKVAAWATWVAVFAFAMLGSVGFASTSISDVTLARGSRVTPAVTAAQAALGDAMKARDLECKGGVGRFCRERETAVETARAGLAAAMGAVQTGADPQAAAMVQLTAWVTAGRVSPSEGDVAMVRLLLLALLPQVGGLLLMVSRRTA